MKIERIVNENAPITDGAPIVYTERKQGVLPEMDIRTDRFDIAIEAMTTVASTNIARRNKAIEDRETKVIEMKKDGGAESTQGEN